MAADELVRIQQAHHRRLLGVQEATADLIGEAWDTFAGLDDLAAAEFEAAATVIVDTARAQTSTLATAYMQANDRAGGFPSAGLKPAIPTIRGGVPTPEVYHRSIVEARRLISVGTPYEQAAGAGRARATGTARTDVSLTNKAAIDAGGDLRSHVVGYRRVLTGKSCAFCATASTQRYRRAGLLPLHPRCDCDVAEIIGKEDPGRIINRGLLEQIQAAGAETGRPDYWNGPYMVDESGAVRYKKLETIRGDDGKALLGPDGNPLRRTVLGEKVKPDVVEHGEMGPMLTSGRTPPPASAPGPARPSTAPSAAEQPRSRAKPSDPDVLAEASRRNVSPARVVEIREEKAQRRFLEDRARREAAKALGPNDPDVRDVAARFGVHPDDVISARARVADVRKVAREEAARVQADAIAELQRLDAVRMKNPPRVGAKTDMGTAARRGEYDWLEKVSDREKARLSRQWYGGNASPDQMTFQMSAALGRDLDVDEAMQLWLQLNRRAEAAGALRRGKLPSPEAYSGQIDPAKILGRLEADGYDVEILFGDDLAAAGHIAEVETRLVRDDALQYLAEAANPIEGPSPYRMSFQAWEDEVREVEHAVREGFADDAQRRRFAELVPQYLDEPDLDYENLYARIVSTARKAGEEVADDARIPWQ